jgi:UDP-glucose 4-epimerase
MLKLKKSKILVTGGAGYIGSHVTEQLIKIKKDVVILDNLKTGYKFLINKKAKFIKGDISNTKLLKKTIEQNNISTIIHLAGLIDVIESERYKKKYYTNNVLGTLNLIKTIKNSTVKYFIFSSSAGVYGNIKKAAKEKMKTKPINYYAFTKLKCETLIKKYSKIYNFNYAILRYFNVAGASLTGKIGIANKKNNSFFKILAKEAVKMKPIITIYGNKHKTKDGTCLRDFIHVSDLASIHLKVLEVLDRKKKSFLINCGYGKANSVLEIANLFKKHINKYTLIKFQKARKGEIVISCSNTEKMKKLLKWKPKFNNINLILKNAINWEKSKTYLSIS